MVVKNIFLVLLSVVVLSSALPTSAWTGPTTTPPGGNIVAPLNVSTTSQIKVGSLGVGGLAVYGNAILSTLNGYFNFGTTTGSTGYGIRDNAGTIEFKNYDGTWKNLNTLIQVFLSDNHYTAASSAEWGTTEPWDVVTAKNLNEGLTSVSLSGNGKYQTAVGPYEYRIYQSSNYGTTWTVRGPSIPGWTHVSMSDSGRYQLALPINDKLYVSSDYGVTWVAKSTAIWFAGDVSETGQHQVALSTGGVYISNDYGVTWVLRTTPVSARGIAISADGTRQVLVGYGGSPTQVIVYVSSDSGNTWGAPVLTTASPAGGSNLYAEMSDDGRIIAFLYTRGIYLSTDYGATWEWKELYTGNPWSAYGMAMSSDGSKMTLSLTLPPASTRDLYTTKDYGATWQAKGLTAYGWQGIGMSNNGALQTAVYPDSGTTGKTYSTSVSSSITGDISIGLGSIGCVRTLDGTLISGTCLSDLRLKKNVQPLAHKGVLDRLTAIEPSTFFWKSEENPQLNLGDEQQVGLIAQQVEETFPELVANDTPSGYKQVKYSELPIYLLQAVKEMWQRDAERDDKLWQLEQRIKQLEEGH